jgi:hypothetical protein
MASTTAARYIPEMLALIRNVAVSVAVPTFAFGCAHSPDTVVHFSAPPGATWEVRETNGALVCSLPCSVELDEEEAVSVLRSDGRTRFVVHQEQLGEGNFSGTVQVRRKQTGRVVAARALAAALSGAGSALVEGEDRKHVAAGVLLSGVGAAARAAIDAWRPAREELWVQRSAKR